MIKAVIDLHDKIAHFHVMGKIMSALGASKAWPGYDCGLSKEEYENLEAIIHAQKHRNGWFTETEVRRSLAAWGLELKKEKLEGWVSSYDLPIERPRVVGLIMAGNIPLVGLHDMISVLLAGHSVLAKTSKDDSQLIKVFAQVLITMDERWKEWIHWVDGPMKGQEAIIATGSNNTSRYFEHYFSSVPHIIRKNRTSVAILDGTESEEEMKGLAEDIFAYFGLGCRNVTKLYLSKEFDLDIFFKSIFPYADIVQNNKYANNYDYHRSVYLLNGDDLLENGFLLLKEDSSLHSPVSCMFFERYEDRKSLDRHLEDLKNEIQCIVSKSDTPFGQAQQPRLADYADGEDTMKFLRGL
jgi:hypothetical protein